MNFRLCSGAFFPGIRLHSRCPYVTRLLLPQFSERELAESDRQGAIRAEAVKGAMLHVWSGYREKAWGTDEVRPKSGSGRATWGGTLLSNASRLAVHSSHCVLSRVGLLHVIAGSSPARHHHSQRE